MHRAAADQGPAESAKPYPDEGLAGPTQAQIPVAEAGWAGELQSQNEAEVVREDQLYEQPGNEQGQPD